MGIFNHNVIDTTPGAGGVFSPSNDFTDDGKAFIEFMKSRYKDVCWGQRMVCQVYFINTVSRKVEFKGPFIDEAKRILRKIGAKI